MAYAKLAMAYGFAAMAFASSCHETSGMLLSTQKSWGLCADGAADCRCPAVREQTGDRRRVRGANHSGVLSLDWVLRRTHRDVGQRWPVGGFGVLSEFLHALLVVTGPSVVFLRR